MIPNMSTEGFLENLVPIPYVLLNVEASLYSLDSNINERFSSDSILVLVSCTRSGDTLNSSSTVASSAYSKDNCAVLGLISPILKNYW